MYYKKACHYQSGKYILGHDNASFFECELQSFQSLNFDFQFSFDTYKLEETLTKVKDRLNHAIEVCRKKINDATQSLERCKNKGTEIVR